MRAKPAPITYISICRVYLRLNEKRSVISLEVLAAYARDMGRGVIRIDHRSMDILAVSTGDTVEVFGKSDGAEALCYPLLPSDEGMGITRIDPKIRKMIGVEVGDVVTIGTVERLQAEKFGKTKEAPAAPAAPASTPIHAPAKTDAPAAPPKAAEEGEESSTASRVTFAGSCIDFEKERANIMEFVGTLEFAVRSKSQCRCYTDGKKTLGWDFFHLELDTEFIQKMIEVYPDIEKEEGSTFEQRLALWMNKQLKNMRLEYNLKLKDVPQQKIKGFRLDPESFRGEKGLDDLR